MKKFFKILGIIVLLVVAFVLIAGLFVSKDYHFQKDIVINAPKAKVWAHTGSLQGMNKWSPWVERDPNIQATYEGQEGAVGSKYSWKGNSEVGEGNMTLTKVENQSENNINIQFIKPWEGSAASFVRLKDEGTSTRVTWGFDSRSPYPMNVMHLFMNMDKMMDEDYTKGLNKLKSLSEQ